MANKFKSKKKKLPQLNTGAVIFDTLNGKKEKYSTGELKTLLGITSSKIYNFAGPTSTGKTTMTVDLAYRIVEPYENGHVFLMDFEHAFEEVRIQQLTGLFIDEIDEKFTVIEDVGKKDLFDEKREAITVSSIGKLVQQIYDFKMDNREDFMTIIDGKPAMEPTIIIIDSIAATITDKQQEEGGSNNMTGAVRAKDLGETFNILNPLLAPANITMFLVNHLHEDVNTGMSRKPAMLRDLKMGETMPGGKGLNYLIGTSVILRRGRKLKEEKDYGVDGMYVSMVLAKSRGAATGKFRDLIFIPERGFLWDLSLIDYLLDNNKLEGSIKFTMPGYDKQKFSRKMALELCDTDPEFVTALRKYGTEVLSDLIPEAATRPLTPEEEEKLQADIMKQSAEKSAEQEEE